VSRSGYAIIDWLSGWHRGSYATAAVTDTEGEAALAYGSTDRARLKAWLAMRGP